MTKVFTFALNSIIAMPYLLRHITIMFAVVILTLLPQASSAQEDDEGNDDATQHEIDSLNATITPMTPDSIKARTYYHISAISSNADTTLHYAMKALRYCTEKDTTILAKCNSNIGWAYQMNGNYNAALKYIRKGIEYFVQSGDSANIPTAYIIIANVYEKQNYSDSALQTLNKALDISIRLRDTTMISACYTTMASVSYNKKYYTTAEDYLRKALRIDSLANDLNGMASDYQWLANIYAQQYSDSAQEERLIVSKNYFQKAISLFEAAGTENPLSVIGKYETYGDIADVFIKLAISTGNEKYADSCLTYFHLSEKFCLQNGYSSMYIDAGRAYAQYLLFKQKYKEAEQYLRSIEQYFDDETSEIFMREHHQMLKAVYLKLGDWRKAYQHLEEEYKYATLITNDSSMSAIADFKTEQATMQERMKHEADEKIHAEQQSKMNAIIGALIIGLILAAALVVAIVRALRIRKKANAELVWRNELLNQQKTEIEAQRDEIENQKNIITHQWQDVETANRKILESINYAQRIQTAAIPTKKEIDALFSENFVFYRPRNIVSGDFYFAAKCGRYSVMITADCTGHGIPGGFLSMLGISALKEYVTTEYDAENPGIVLDKMRNFIKATLNNKSNDSVGDGMDMTVCCIDIQSMTLKYAIANQTAYIIRDGNPIRLKGDKMPIGQHIHDNVCFQTLTQPIMKGDMLYMFSDGIQDQIGGSGDDERLRFSSQRLLSTLQEISPMPMSEQLETISQTITEWQGAYLQMDDMTLVGIRI